MATQVEFGSALTSLAGISEPRNEATFRHSFTSPLSDTGPSSLAPLILEGRNKVGNAVGPTTMPSAASRPPWAPRPFSREATTDTFATVKPPIPALKPSSTAPKSPTVAQIFEDAPRGSNGNVPPLLDQNSMESQPPREPVAHLPVCLSPQANTVILFESRSPAKGGPEEGGSKAQEGQLLRSQSEKWPRRRPSLSTDPKLLSWAPHWREAIAGGPRGSASSVEPQQRPTLAAETHSQAGGRPAASAGFREAWQEQTQSTPPVAASDPGTPKPRPLPTDLTGRFPPQELSWQKKPCLAESREKSDRALEATGARSAAAGLRGAAPGVKSASLLAESPQSCLPSAAVGAAPPGQAVPEDSGQNSRKEEKVPWELGIQGKPSVGQHNASTGQPLGEWGEVSPQEAGLRNTDALGGKHGGCGKKTVPLLDPSAKPRAPSPSESVCGSPGQELRILNIQQRIKVLTAENAGSKAGRLRASFRSRPLSTDLTKMFSGPVTASELKPKRQSEWNRKPAGEIRDAPEDETLPTGGKDVVEVNMAGSPWKPPLLAKTPSIEGPPKRQGTLAKGRPNASSPGKDPGLVLSSKARTFSSSSTEDAGPKTVRATMFEHHVQRHSVVTSQLGPEPALLSLMAPFGDSPSRGQESGTERMLGDGQSGKASAREGDASGGPGGSKDPRPSTEDEDSPLWAEEPSREKDEQSASKGMEDSVLAQRIEPRYEVLQTVGERAQSEAVATISGGKAITLRRQRPLKENRRAGGYGRSKGWSEAPAPGTGLLKGLPAFENQGAFPREGTGADRNQAGQQPASEKAASFRMKEGRNFAPWLDTEKERWLAPAGLRDRIPRRAGARVPGADGCEGQKTSPLQSGSCPGLLFGLDLKPPQGSEGQKLHLAGYGAQEQWEGSAEGKELRGAGIEVRWASSFRNVSAPKGSDRWRRKTLPHSAARLEGPGEPPQDPAELASRSDALHLMDGAAAKRSPQALRGPGPRQAEVACASSPEKPLSPSEPKATYFAVTCHISEEEEEINNQPGRAAAVAPPVSASRRADPSDCQHREGFAEGGSSPGRPLSRPRGGRGASDRSVAGASREPLTEARDQGQELLQRQLEAASEGRLARADPPFCSGTRSPYLAPLQQDSQRKRSGALHFGRAEEKAPDHYRSRVVDIDELMAEYGGESQKLCEWEGQRESTFLPWEKWPPRHNSSGNLPCSSDQREKSRVGRSLGSRGPGPGASSGEGSHVHEGDALEIHPQESRAREEKSGPPQWGKPDTEKAKPWSAEPPGPRTKAAFLVGREEGGGTGQGPQSARDATPGPHPACMDLRALWKEASPKKGAVLAPAGGWCPGSNWGGRTGWKAEPQAGVWEKGSPAAHTGTERSSSTASLGTGSTPDLKCSSEKNHQSQARPSFPSEPRLDQPHVCQRFAPERPGVWLSKGGPSPRDCFSHGGTRDLGKEGLPVDHDDATTTKRSVYLLTQRQSFHKERRTDHWSGDHFKECFSRPSAEARDTDVLVQEADSRYGTWGDQRHRGDSFTPESPSWEGSVAPAQKPSPGHRASLYSSQRDLATAAGEQRSPSLADSSSEADSASPPAEKASPDFSFLEVANSLPGLGEPEEPGPAGQKTAAAPGSHLPRPQEECQRSHPAAPVLCGGGGSSQRLDVQGLHRREAPQEDQRGGRGAPSSREAAPCPAAAAALSGPGPLRPQGSTQEKARFGRGQGGSPPCTPLQVAQRSVSGTGSHPREGREAGGSDPPMADGAEVQEEAGPAGEPPLRSKPRLARGGAALTDRPLPLPSSRVSSRLDRLLCAQCLPLGPAWLRPQDLWEGARPPPCGQGCPQT